MSYPPHVLHLPCMIALLEAWRAGLFRREHWLPNLVSGVIVGVVALPLAMAFAIASGVKPEQRLYTAIIAGLAVSIFGGSRVQIAGPTGAFIVILASITAQYGVDGLQVATLMAGIILVVLGAARLGRVIKYIPAPGIVGFTAGIGVIIWGGQWQPFFGLPKIEGAHFHEKFWHLLQALPQLHLATTALAVVSLLILIFSPRLPYVRRVPGPLVAMVVATVLQTLFQCQGVANIVSPLFGGFAATGAIARTATNVRNGGNSPLAGITHAIALVLIILLFAPLASDIPLAALAAILFVVVFF